MENGRPDFLQGIVCVCVCVCVRGRGEGGTADRTATCCGGNDAGI